MDWFDVPPGQLPILPLPEENGLLIAKPDVVRLPADLPDGQGGKVVRVLGYGLATCPVHPGHKVKTYMLEGGIFAAECDRWYWHKRK